MAQVLKIAAELRDPAKNKGTGSRASRKLRKQGRIPAIVYGHQQAPTPISLERDAVWEMVKRQSHLTELDIAGTSETVVVREMQWDHLGKEIIHLDFARVSAGESVDTEVRIELKGTAPGVAEGGVLEHLLHSIHLVSRADAIPDSIKVDISDLHLGKAIHVREIKLPEGTTFKGDVEALVVHITSPAAEEPTTEAPEGTQPEVIKPERKEKDE